MTDASPLDPTTAGVPADALRRLQQSAAGQAGAVFTSDLSVNEFALVRAAGFRPLGLVMGSSIFHIGIQVSKWGQNMELDVLSQAMYTAREQAMARMDAEAHALGADGVVGVRLHVNPQEWGDGICEFVAVGTAILCQTDRYDGITWRDNRDRPFSSDLTGQDFWTLLQSGYAPLGLVLGTCVYHVAHRSLGQLWNQAGRNVEIPAFTQALYDARELAMSRMQAEASALGAEGIVGVALTEHNHVWGQHATEFFAVGTAVRPLRADHTVPQPQMVVPLT